MKAKFLVGGEVVTAYVPDGETLAETDHLTIRGQESAWVAERKQLKESYTPISETAQHYYDIIIDENS